VCLVTYAGRREHVRAVRQQLHRLVTIEGVPPGEIALLTGHKLDADSPFAAGQVLGNLTLTTTAPPGPNEVLVSTIQRFKGLERRAVILADLDQTVHPDLPTVLYVGASRAKEHLAVVIDQAAPPAILARLQAAATPAPSPTPEGR
ncbi:MAG: ATP-binding domain-containing protein, partial [Armatimonadetes bacterium]|nr:ATP-binding domain-containing protein [Armatimonadota bacterium]